MATIGDDGSRDKSEKKRSFSGFSERIPIARITGWGGSQFFVMDAIKGEESKRKNDVLPIVEAIQYGHSNDQKSLLAFC
jgi:hypothetical protein